jgi:hypothetical protein
VILGSAVAFGFRNLDNRRHDAEVIAEERRNDQRRYEEIKREERQRIDAYRAAFTDELWSAYHRVKAVRRTLNAYGFGLESGAFTEKQCLEYDRQMTHLDDAQLTLEKLKRNVEGQAELFDKHADTIKKLMRDAERYVNRIIDDWEGQGLKVETGADRRSVMREHGHLSAFLSSSDAKEGIDKLSGPVTKTANLVQQLRFQTKPRLSRSS